MARFIQRGQALVVPLSLLMLAVVLWLCFRRISGVVLPMVVTGVSLVLTLGLYSLAGHSLNTITSLLAPVVMVLSVSTSIHLYNGWLEQRAVPVTSTGWRR